MLAYSMVLPARHDVPGWHGQRPARIAVEGHEIDLAALLDGAPFVVGLPPQAESVRDLASRIAQARERKPIAPLGLQAVVRRLCETTTNGAGLHRRAVVRAEEQCQFRHVSARDLYSRCTDFFAGRLSRL